MPTFMRSFSVQLSLLSVTLLCLLCTTNPQIRCEPRRNVAPRDNPCRYMIFTRLVAAPPRCVKFRKEQYRGHSAAEPQPKVEGASILDKMLTFSENTTSWEERSAMKEFIAKYRNEIAGVLSGFDRLIFRGTLRSLAYVAGMQTYLTMNKVLLKDFGRHALHISQRLKDASLAGARALGRPVKYLASGRVKKEEVARRMAAEQGVVQGLLCVLSCVEPCQTFQVYRHREARKLELLPRWRKCLFLYHYWKHPRWGFMHARIQ